MQNGRNNDKKRQGQVRGERMPKGTSGGQVRGNGRQKPRMGHETYADTPTEGGQGSVERSFKSARGEQPRRENRGGRSTSRGTSSRGEREERVNGAPVYTATFKVNRSDELLEFLLRKCNTSRNNVKSLLVRKQVLVNGRVVTQYNFILAKDDEVKIAKRPVKDGEVAKMPTAAKRTPRAPKPVIKIVYEDEDFVAIDKPVGLLSVESDKETECAYGYV